MDPVDGILTTKESTFSLKWSYDLDNFIDNRDDLLIYKTDATADPLCWSVGHYAVL